MRNMLTTNLGGDKPVVNEVVRCEQLTKLYPGGILAVDRLDFPRRVDHSSAHAALCYLPGAGRILRSFPVGRVPGL
jgi:hypothetical protein